MEEAINVLRTCNALLAVVLMYVCTMRLVRDWHEWTRREQVVRVHLVAYLFVIAYSATEQVALGATPGLRSVLIFAVNVSLALGLWRHRNDPVRPA